VTGWLLDTNIVSELRRPRPEPRVTEFVAAQPIRDLFVSDMTLAELRYGTELVTDPGKRATLQHWLTHALRPLFAERVLPVNEDVLVKWQVLAEQYRRSGRIAPAADLIIAATALLHGMTVVTRNTADFTLSAVPVFNPWTDHPPAAD
jgi:predicted nucleic acid-binding protein